MNYFNIRLGKRKNVVRHFAIDGEEYRPPADGFYSTDAFTDNALDMLRHHDADRPFFLYLAYNAPHWPLHAPQEEIDKYLGKYMGGWAKLRRSRMDRMQAMGLIPKQWKLSPQDPDAADWDKLDEAKQREMERKMAVYAGVIDRHGPERRPIDRASQDAEAARQHADLLPLRQRRVPRGRHLRPQLPTRPDRGRSGPRTPTTATGCRGRMPRTRRSVATSTGFTKAASPPR